ncbi:MAG TPA: VWA domain-containing protein [Myxococcaceae bacterium]|nr:VWA domain-containing protein [Myxococcaceae bacterium]
MTSNSESKRLPAELPTAAAARWSLLLGSRRGSPIHAAAEPDPIGGALDVLYGVGDPLPDSRAGALERLRRLDTLERILPDEACAMAREDALRGRALDALLAHPEQLRPVHLAPIEPTAEVIARLLRVADVLPAATRDALREKVDVLARRISSQLESTLSAASGRGAAASDGGLRRTGSSLDVARTLRHNLRNYDPVKRQLGVDRLYFHRARSHRPPTRVIIALDSSGSMDSARLHAVLMAAVLTRIPHLDPRLLLFDTRVMDVSDQLQDPVGLLLGTRLGGGTDLGAALTQAARLAEDPRRALVVLISDFEPGGSRARFVNGVRALTDRGVTLLCLHPAEPMEPSAPDAGRTWRAELKALGIPVHDCPAGDPAGPLASVLGRHGSRA